MTSTTNQPRRRVLRSRRTPAEHNARARKLAAKQMRLQKEQQTLTRWMAKLRRAFHAVEKQQKTISRIEREIARLQQT